MDGSFRRLFSSDIFATHHCGGGEDRFDDIVVSSATADIPLQPSAHFSFSRFLVPTQEISGGHHHAWRTKSALQAMIFVKRLLDDAERAIVIRHTLNGSYRRTISLKREHRTRFDARAVEMNNASAALARVAADMGSGETEVFT
jgi:hypothetical protein